MDYAAVVGIASWVTATLRVIQLNFFVQETTIELKQMKNHVTDTNRTATELMIRLKNMIDKGE